MNDRPLGSKLASGHNCRNFASPLSQPNRRVSFLNDLRRDGAVARLASWKHFGRNSFGRPVRGHLERWPGDASLRTSRFTQPFPAQSNSTFCARSMANVLAASHTELLA